MTKIRNGKAAYDRLRADVEAFVRGFREIGDYATSAKIVSSHADYGRRRGEDLLDYLDEVLEPMLQRIDDRKQQELLRRVASLEDELADLRKRLDDLERERRTIPHLREVKAEGR